MYKYEKLNLSMRHNFFYDSEFNAYTIIRQILMKHIPHLVKIDSDWLISESIVIPEINFH